MQKKRIAAFTAICILMSYITANASIMGILGDSWYTNIGVDTNFYANTFMDENVGQQKEFFVEYAPNEAVVPVIVNGDKIYGKRDINGVIKYMKENNLEPVAGINGDYFSFKTGIPMGHTIMQGEIVTKDNTGQNAVGFNNDGTGFISWLEIRSQMTSSFGSVDIECINKWCQPGMVPFYLLTDDFGEETKTSSDCAFVIFGVTGGRLSIGKTLNLRVEEKFEYNGSIAIPKDKMVLCIDKTAGNPEYLEFVSKLSVGDEVTISSESVYDKELWNKAMEGISTIGGRLIEKGIVNSKFEAGANPRTAIGIKADGTIVMYAIDGRQKEYSYGLQLKTLAKRMAELGCVDAVNLDGGGSTVIGAVFNSDTGFTVVNKPSEGKPRAVANYIFLKRNIKAPTGVAHEITGKFRTNNNYLSGAAENLGNISVKDTGGFDMKIENLSYSIRNTYDAESTVDSAGNVSLKGQGESIVTISANNITRDVSLFSYDSPDDILVYENGIVKEVESYSFNTGDVFCVDLTADAYLNSAFLNAEDHNFTWSLKGDIGEITGDGLYTLYSAYPTNGEIVVSAGEYSHSIPVTITGEPVLITNFEDISWHWAEESIKKLENKKIVSGIPENGKLYFKPEQKVTRIQFAVMLCNMIGINSEDYAEEELMFADSKSFDEWMKNYAKAAYIKGFIKGRETENGVVFDPNSEITRAEAMVMLYRLNESDGIYDSVNFKDSSEIPDWAEGAVNALYAKGIINGYEDNTIKPGGNIKRAEAAAMLCRYIEG